MVFEREVKYPPTLTLLSFTRNVLTVIDCWSLLMSIGKFWRESGRYHVWSGLRLLPYWGIVLNIILTKYTVHVQMNIAGAISGSTCQIQGNNLPWDSYWL